MDMMSSLPDDIVCHILSFLPFHHSLQTSLLSTRFRHVWKSVPVFYCDYDDPSLKHKTSYPKLVDQLLENPNNLWSIRKFRLKYGSYYNGISRLVSKVPTIATNLEEIDIHHRHYGCTVFLPVEVFSLPKLKILKLVGAISVPTIPTTCLLPSLVTLHFQSINMLGDEQSFLNLLAACPSVQNFYINYRTSNKFKFHSLRLKDLNDSTHSIYATILSSVTDIHLLEVLNIISHRLKNLVTRVIPNNVDSLLRSNNHVANINFQNLVHLRIGATSGVSLLQFLKLSPNVTSMRVSIMDIKSQGTRELVDIAPPVCFVDKLETVEFYTLKESTMEMVKYILKNALVLKEMIFLYGRKGNESIMNAPRGSSQCQITFIND